MESPPYYFSKEELVQYLLLLNLFSHASSYVASSGSCVKEDGTKMCCNGRNLDCQGLQIHAVYRTARLSDNTKVCFCDEYCTITHDCCPDYRRVCEKPKVDCSLSNWSEWSVCSRRCGQGNQTRIRKVFTLGQNGGRSCPDTIQNRPCIGSDCSRSRFGRSDTRILELFDISADVAHILPAFGDVQKKIQIFDMRRDIRRKLYQSNLILENKTDIPDPEPYCVMYEIVQSNPACRRYDIQWNQYTAESWKSFIHIRRNISHPTGYSQIRQPSNNPATNEIKYTELLEKFSFKPRQRICATCFPVYMRPELGNRCPGTGYHGKLVRWRALLTEDCHGTFRVVAHPKRNCKCISASDSYILT